MIRMTNKEGNGFADAYSESEAKDYEAKGWTRYVQVKQVEQVEPVEVVETVEVIEPVAPKRGRPFKVN